MFSVVIDASSLQVNLGQAIAERESSPDGDYHECNR
jgi:hypothetical protein